MSCQTLVWDEAPTPLISGALDLPEPSCTRSAIDRVGSAKVDPDPVKVNAPAAIALDKDCVPA